MLLAFTTLIKKYTLLPTLRFKKIICNLIGRMSAYFQACIGLCSRCLPSIEVQIVHEFFYVLLGTGFWDCFRILMASAVVRNHDRERWFERVTQVCARLKYYAIKTPMLLKISTKIAWKWNRIFSFTIPLVALFLWTFHKVRIVYLKHWISHNVYSLL